MTPPSSRAPNPYDLYILLEPLRRLWETTSPWSHRPALVRGLHAIELCLRLLGDAACDPRPAALREQRQDRFEGHLAAQARLLARLLEGAELPPAQRRTGPHPAHSPGFDVLALLDPGRVGRITFDLTCALQGLGFRLGVEEQMAAARARAGLRPLPPDDRPALDYEAVVRPAAVAAVREAEPQGPEDHLFSTVHQITECWLEIGQDALREAASLATRESFAEGAARLDTACRCVAMATETGQLLAVMVLADFHPLRVKLRDGSGAQARSVQALPSLGRAAFAPLVAALDRRGLRLLHVLERPDHHLSFHQYMTGLKLFSRELQDFLFRHYLLTLTVMGSNTLGALGYRMNTMVERAATPLFSEINAAHHEYGILTNFRHGKDSGRVIMAKELAAGHDPYHPTAEAAVLSPDHIRARVKDYFAFIESRDTSAWVALFEPEVGHFCDNPGSKPYVGRHKLRVFLEGLFDALHSIVTHLADLEIEDHTARARWRFDAVSYHGKPVVFEGTEEFVFDASGRILTATASWEPNDVAEQLWPHAGGGTR